MAPELNIWGSLNATLLQWAWVVSAARRRLNRAMGRADYAILIFACLGVLVAGMAWVRHTDTYQQKLAWAQEAAAARSAPKIAPSNENAQSVAVTDARGKIAKFDKILLPHEAIPYAIGDLLKAAQQAGVTIRHGEYKSQIDASGGFMRYQMNLPVRGNFTSMMRFVHTALSSQRALALTHVAIKRDRIDSADIEATMQWILFVKLDNVQEAQSAPFAQSGEKS